MLFTVPDNPADDQRFMMTLYKKYRLLMFATAQRYTSEPHDCEDVLQDAIESLCGKISKLRDLPENALATYIVTTVKNTALNLQKHRGIVDRYVQPLEETDLRQIEASADSPERLLERKEHWESVYNAWRQLPEQDRELLYQKYILEKSNEELARWLNCGKDSVRMRLTRIRRKILALMEEANASDKT